MAGSELTSGAEDVAYQEDISGCKAIRVTECRTTQEEGVPGDEEEDMEPDPQHQLSGPKI